MRRLPCSFLFVGIVLCGAEAIAFSDADQVSGTVLFQADLDSNSVSVSGTAGKASTTPEVIADDYAVLWVLLGLVAAAMAAWVYGRWGGFAVPASTRHKAWIVALVLFVPYF